MGREAGLAQGQHLHPRSLQAPPFSRRQWEAVNEWAAARPSWAVPAAGWRRDRGGVRPPLGALDAARGGRCFSQQPKPHLGLPAGSGGGRGSLGSRGPGHAEQPLSRLEKPLPPALGSSHHSLCLRQFLLLVHIRPPDCCLHFGSTLQSHRSSRKANRAMPPSAGTLQRDPCPSHHGAAGPACLLGLPLTQPPHHVPFSCLWAFAHAVPSTVNALASSLMPCSLPLIIQTSDQQSPPSRKPPRHHPPTMKTKTPITYFPHSTFLSFQALSLATSCLCVR